jgi:hypothetical protein
MSTFSDKNGVEWTVELDAWSINQIKKDTGEDILDETGQGLVNVCGRGDLLTMALWVLCEEQAEERKITDRKFGRAMVKPEVVAAGAQALQEAVLDFFPPKQKEAITSVIASQNELNSARMEMLEERVADKSYLAELKEAMAMGMERFRTEALAELGRTREKTESTPSSPDAKDSEDTSDTMETPPEE